MYKSIGVALLVLFGVQPLSAQDTAPTQTRWVQVQLDLMDDLRGTGTAAEIHFAGNQPRILLRPGNVLRHLLQAVQAFRATYEAAPTVPAGGGVIGVRADTKLPPDWVQSVAGLARSIVSGLHAQPSGPHPAGGTAKSSTIWIRVNG